MYGEHLFAKNSKTLGERRGRFEGELKVRRVNARNFRKNRAVREIYRKALKVKIICCFYCCHGDIDFASNLILTNFSSQSVGGENLIMTGQG